MNTKKMQFRTLTLAVLGALAGPAAFAAHPLFTDDTGTQGKGKFQLEVIHERGSDDVAGATNKSNVTQATLAYGLTDPIDVFVALPHVAYDFGGTTNSGLSDAQVGIKWRFHEAGPLSLAVKPAITLATGDETKGLGNGKAGYSAYLMGTYNVGPWTFNGQLGRVHEAFVGGGTADSNAFSVGGWYEMDKKVRFVVDYGRTTNPAPAEDNAFAIVGAIFLVNGSLDVDVAYRKGISDIETDATIMLGVTKRF